MTRSSDIHNVGIGGVGDNCCNYMGVLETHIGESLSAVNRFIYTVSPADAVTTAFFSGSDPYNIRVLLENRNVADRRCFVVCKYLLPGYSRINRLPDTSGSGRYNYMCEIIVKSFDVRYSSGHISRSDVSPPKILKHIFRGNLRKNRRRRIQ